MVHGDFRNHIRCFRVAQCGYIDRSNGTRDRCVESCAGAIEIADFAVGEFNGWVVAMPEVFREECVRMKCLGERISRISVINEDSKSAGLFVEIVWSIIS